MEVVYHIRLSSRKAGVVFLEDSRTDRLQGRKASLGCTPPFLAWSPAPMVWRSSQQTASGGTAQPLSSLHITSKMDKNVAEKSKPQTEPSLAAMGAGVAGQRRG